MRIQYFVGDVSRKQTGGQIVHYELMFRLSKDHEIVNEIGIRKAFSWDTLRANLWCWTRVLKVHPDIIVQDSYYASCLLAGNIFAKIFKIPVFIFVQEIFFDNFSMNSAKNAFWAFYAELFLRSSTIIIANSEYTRKAIIKKHKRLRPEKVKVLYPAVANIFQNQGAFEAKVREKNNVLNLICVANIRRNKGQDYLLKALSFLKGYDWQLRLIGKIKEESFYKELCGLIDEFGLGERVHFKGFLDQKVLIDEYANADIFVLPTLREGYCMAVAEALQFGLPVVASRVGGIPEVIGEEDPASILIASGDVTALTETIQRLIIDLRLRWTMKEQAHKRAAELPTLEEVCERFYSMLVKIVKEAPDV